MCRDKWYVTGQKAKGALQLIGCHLVRLVTVTKYILLVDDSKLIRLATRHFLESHTGFVICGEAVTELTLSKKPATSIPT